MSTYFTQHRTFPFLIPDTHNLFRIKHSAENYATVYARLVKQLSYVNRVYNSSTTSQINIIKPSEKDVQSFFYRRDTCNFKQQHFSHIFVLIVYTFET